MSEDGLERRAYKPGEVIFKQGDVGDEAFIVETGQIEIARGNNKAEMVIGTVEPGALVGEMALIDASPRMATARAMKKTTCVVVPKKVFQRVVDKSNPVLKIVIHTLMARLRGESAKSAKQTLG